MTETPIRELNKQADSPPTLPVAAKSLKEAGEISLLDLLIVLAERKTLISCITAVVALLAIVISFLLPARYTATVTFLTPQQNTSIGAALA
jgi:uncharacterized protein involved in exopolysaccharide biosynthesis